MKSFKEASFKVDVAGLPPIFMDAKSSVEIRKKLRRQLKFPDDIENIERVTKGEKIKSFKDRLKTTLSAKGQDVEESAAYHAGLSKSTKSKRDAQFDKQAKMSDDNPAAYKPAPGDANSKTKTSVHTKKFKAMYGEDYSKGLDGKKLKASKALIRRYEEEMLIDPKAMAKKTTFLSPQNKDKLKTDMARLKKALGPNHPMNKSKTEAKDPAEYDEEGGMVKGQLRTMIDAAQELHDSLDKDDNLPEWVQSKITKATDYIDSVRDYMASEKDDD